MLTIVMNAEISARRQEKNINENIPADISIIKPFFLQ